MNSEPVTINAEEIEAALAGVTLDDIIRELEQPSPPINGSPTFRVVPLDEAAQRLRRWGQWARGQGGQIYADYLQTVRTIDYRLAYEPLEWAKAVTGSTGWLSKYASGRS